MKKKLSTRQYLRAIISVASLSFKTAPWPISAKLLGVALDAFLPIAITYFAATTTTELAAAFAGDAAAGQRAITYIVITAALGLGATLWSSFDQYIQAVVRYKIEAKVSDMMYEHFLSLDFWRYDDKDTADLYDRAQHFSRFFAYIFDRLGTILTQLVSLVFSLIALVIFLPWIALLALIAIIPGVIIQFKLSRAQIDHWNRNVDARRAQNFIEGNLFEPNSIAELRLNGLVRHLLQLRSIYRDKDEKARLDFERQYIGKRLLADTIEAATQLGALIWIALLIIAREQPIGQFIYVQQLVARVMSNASRFVSQISIIDEDLANLYDYEEFIQLPAGTSGTTELTSPPATITFKNVSFHYPQHKRTVLKNISLNIPRGQHVAIVGENGAGKSTLIKLLTGLYHPTKGTILLDETNLKDIEIASWHRQLSVLQQDFEHYIFTTIQDNVVFGDINRPLDEIEVDKALQRAEANEFIDKLPQKRATIPSVWMEDSEGNKGTNLSGGQWQRLALARNFYRDAPIIILDEPTSAIDALAEGRIFKRLFSKQNPKTVITISHRLSTVEKADHIIVLKDGQIVEQGVHADLVRQKGEYYKMFEGQL